MDERPDIRQQPEGCTDEPQSAGDPHTAPGGELLFLALAAGRELSKLAGLELRLAVDSALRMAVLVVVALMLVLLAWLALAGLVASLVYSYLGSLEPAIAAFLLCQLLGLAAARGAWRYYRRCLSMPHTREQLVGIVGLLRQGT